jgi:hypothetical protein
LNDPSADILETQTDEGLALRATFVWRDGRWAHSLELIRDGQRLCEFQSLEGNAEQNFPPSPPLQQLHRTDLPDGRVALLLVGMAGRSHWSVSCEVEPGQPRILFDVACRAVPACQAILGSSYQLTDVAAAAVSESQISWLDGAVRGTLRGLPSAPEGLPCRLTVDGTGLAIRPVSLDPIPARWRYELVLERT